MSICDPHKGTSLLDGNQQDKKPRKIKSKLQDILDKSTNFSFDTGDGNGNGGKKNPKNPNQPESFGESHVTPDGNGNQPTQHGNGNGNQPNQPAPQPLPNLNPLQFVSYTSGDVMAALQRWSFTQFYGVNGPQVQGPVSITPSPGPEGPGGIGGAFSRFTPTGVPIKII